MVRVEKQGAVWTVIHSRYQEARNAMDPQSADALVEAFRAFHADASASVAVREALGREWANRVEAHFHEGAAGALRFAGGLGRHGDFERI